MDNQFQMFQPVSQARRDDPEWIAHKETIRNLFLKEKKYLKGADGVVETMKRLYGFHKSYAPPFSNSEHSHPGCFVR